MSGKLKTDSEDASLSSSGHIKDLKFDPNNARRHNPHNIGMIADSLNEVGAWRSVAIDEEGTIIAGNGTVEAAAQAGIHKVRIIESDGDEIIAVRRRGLSPEQKVRYGLEDNASTDSSSMDALVLKRLKEEGNSFSDIVSDDEYKRLLTKLLYTQKLHAHHNPDDFAEPEDTQTLVRLGDVWQLGENRVICGDSRSPEVVHRLFGNQHPNWMWTDPPYGVDYIGGSKIRKAIKNDGNIDLDDLLRRSFGLAEQYLEPGAPIYVSTPPGPPLVSFINAFQEVGWMMHQILIWNKNSLVPGLSDYQYKHETILYGWKRGKKRPWYGDRKQSTVIDVDRPGRSKEHPTMKPTELIEKMLLNSTGAGDLGYDPFGGSGSTMIAAQMIGRAVYSCELDPSYVAVQIGRWEAVTGEVAELIHREE